ncbi:MAG TPA: 6-phospho-beta-glucosidase [Candidatus Limnocylindrales bacterium]|nr:6-phospho-beta-glucosidase [Candidatus Limnocylindrales bacterium]
MSTTSGSVKVAVVGGGSTYTPELIEGIARRHDRLPVAELALMDVNPERLEVVAGFARRIMERLGWAGVITATDSHEEAVDGASFVLVQLRIGGQQARLTDETIPVRYGTIGQETTGAGGFAKALRTVPVVLELAELTGRRAAPGAWLVDFTNPVGIVTQALLDAGHRAIGLCNVAIGLQRRMASRFGVEPERVRLGHVGLNHLSWVRHVWVDDIDRLPELLDGNLTDLANEAGGIPQELVRVLGAVPSSYLRYYYCFNDVLREQESGEHSRAREVLDIEARLLEMYRDPSLTQKPALLENRGGAFYSEAAAQLMASLHDGRGDIQVVDTRNDGAIPELPDDAVVEVPATITREGPRTLPAAALTTDMLALVNHAKGYERLTVQAATTGDRDVALRALLSNPLVGGYDVASPLLEELLQVNERYLPLFAR